MSGKISIKEVIKNLIYSFASFAMPTAVLQFLIQPILAKELGPELNGQYLTIISFHFFMVGITAAVLNNVRLLQQKQYDEKNLCGDFNLFLALYALIAIVVVPLAWFYFTKSFNITDILLMICIAFMYIYHDYIFAEYRLNLQYNKIFVNNILMSFGYIIGYFLFKLMGRWQVILIGAYAMPTVYDFVNTTFIKEPFKKTPLFKETAKKVATLTCSSSLGTLTNYCDKFILYPILGGTSVSVYYSAALVGKLLLLVSSPLNSVLLSYLVKMKSFSAKGVLKRFTPLILVVIVGYVACVIIGFPLTSFLYPDWADQSKQFIPITVAASMLSLLCHLLNTVVLRFYKMSYQIILQVVSLVIYLILAFAGLHFGGLLGFCIAIMGSNILKLLILVYIIISKKTVNITERKE